MAVGVPSAILELMFMNLPGRFDGPLRNPELVA
jgi:hypothetical protein